MKKNYIFKLKLLIPIILLLIAITTIIVKEKLFSDNKLNNKIITWVNDEIITKQDLENEIILMNNNIISLNEVDTNFYSKYDIKVSGKNRKALINLIDKKLITQRANKIGINISKKQIDEWIMKKSSDSSNDINSALNKLSAKLGLNNNELLNIITDNLKAEKIIKLEISGKIVFDENDMNDYINRNKEKFGLVGIETFKSFLYKITTNDKNLCNEEMLNNIAKSIISDLYIDADHELINSKYSDYCVEIKKINYDWKSKDEFPINIINGNLKLGDIVGPISVKGFNGVYIVKILDSKTTKFGNLTKEKIKKITTELYNEKFLKLYSSYIDEIRNMSYIDFNKNENYN